MNDEPGSGGAGEGGEGEPKVSRPEGFGDAFNSYWDDKKGVNYDALTADFTAAREFQEAHGATIDELSKRREGIPADPKDYKPELPESFEAPEGFEFEIADDDPLLIEARELAKEAGLTQAEFSKLVSLRARIELQQDEMIAKGVEEEKKKLGSNAQARIDQVYKFMGAERQAIDKSRNKTPSEQSAFYGRIFSADEILELENLIAKAKGSGGGFSGGGRTGEEAPAMTDEQWEKMTPTERFNYAHQNPSSRKSQAA